MKIWLVSSEYPTSQDPLRGIFVFDQAKNLQAAGHEIVVMVLDLRSILRKRKLGRFSYVYRDVKYEIISIPVGNVPYKIFDLIGAIAFNVLYKDMISKYDEPDIVHAHFYEIASIVARSSLEKTPFLITEHSSVIHNLTSNKKLWQRMNYTYHKANEVISVSGSLATVIKTKFNIKAEVIPNIIDLSIFNYKKNNSNLFEEKITFVSTGNLVKIKNTDALIKAFAKTFSDNDEVELLICGEGPERKRLTVLIENLNLESKVRLLGQQSRTDLASLYESSNVFVLVSQSETFGVAYVEALASGLPVIATRSGGPLDFVNSSNGILVEVSDLDNIAKALNKMSQQWQDFDRKKISANISRKFAPKRVVEQLERIYSRNLHAKI